MKPIASRPAVRPMLGVLLPAALTLALGAASVAEARITRIVVDTRTSPAFNGAQFGIAGQYETLAGRAFGELDPTLPGNAIITDIQLAPLNANHKVEYTATFLLVKPVDMSRASGLLWHDVPNRGGRITISTDLRDVGDVGLSSGWQGENSGGVAYGAADREYVMVPAAKNLDGSSITGRVMGRILNASGAASQPMIVHSNPVPYVPMSLDTTQATLTEIESETIDGFVGPSHVVPSTDWAWARCDAANPWPGVPDGRQVCLKNGFTANRIYQVVFTARDPPVLGIGFAAFRDIAAFFKYAATDDFGTANPVGGKIKWVLARGSSQSGNFLRAFLHLGFNQAEDGLKVQDGNWPMIAGRRVSLNTRFAMPDGVLKLYEPGSEGPQWWAPFPDPRRGLRPAGILDRCTASNTCPKIIEHFGAAEIWGLKLGPEWVGTDAQTDIPLPANVRRYYIPSTPHGGGNGGFSTTLAAAPACPSEGYGVGTLAANPMPHTQTVNAIRYHFRRWVMDDIMPPPSRWPTIAGGTLTEPTKEAMGFPTIPGLPETAPTGLINPVLDYFFGDGFNYTDGSGIPTVTPPMVKQVIPALVPRVDADGNELGGVTVALREAPLGTYTGWNITAAGVHAGKICNYAGGMIPFRRTAVERLAAGDPRLSLEERYGTHEGYVAAVRAAVDRAVAEGFLLPADGSALVTAAQSSNVLSQ